MKVDPIITAFWAHQIFSNFTVTDRTDISETIETVFDQICYFLEKLLVGWSRLRVSLMPCFHSRSLSCVWRAARIIVRMWYGEWFKLLMSWSAIRKSEQIRLKKCNCRCSCFLSYGDRLEIWTIPLAAPAIGSKQGSIWFYWARYSISRSQIPSTTLQSMTHQYNPNIN